MGLSVFKVEQNVTVLHCTCSLELPARHTGEGSVPFRRFSPRLSSMSSGKVDSPAGMVPEMPPPARSTLSRRLSPVVAVRYAGGHSIA